MANKHMTKMSVSLALREIHLPEEPKEKVVTLPRAGEAAENLELSGMAGERIEWWTLLGNDLAVY